MCSDVNDLLGSSDLYDRSLFPGLLASTWPREWSSVVNTPMGEALFECALCRHATETDCHDSADGKRAVE